MVWFMVFNTFFNTISVMSCFFSYVMFFQLCRGG